MSGSGHLRPKKSKPHDRVCPFAPKADKWADVSLCPLSATTGREQMQQLWKAELLDYFVGEREAA
jgi:hypothetical protein